MRSSILLNEKNETMIWLTRRDCSLRVLILKQPAYDRGQNSSLHEPHQYCSNRQDYYYTGDCNLTTKAPLDTSCQPIPRISDIQTAIRVQRRVASCCPNLHDVTSMKCTEHHEEIEANDTDERVKQIRVRHDSTSIWDRFLFLTRL